MSFDLAALQDALSAHDRVVRVVVAQTRGSTPREVGAAMLVWTGGQSGTIGGGALEHDAATHARALLREGRDQLEHIALGPRLGQCCGGRVTLLSEVFEQARLARITAPITGQITGNTCARATPGAAKTPPLAVQRLLAGARNLSAPLAPQLVQGWMVEPLLAPRQPLWIYGAGHVGRALVQVLAPLPQFQITWLDIDASRFPGEIAHGVTPAMAESPADLVAHAPARAHHLIVTHSHALDLELCHRLLGHGFDWAGLIGSRSKWARFQHRLAGLGHGPARISRLNCPIGRPEFGKHPQAIAVGVAAALLQRGAEAGTRRGGADKTGTEP